MIDEGSKWHITLCDMCPESQRECVGQCCDGYFHWFTPVTSQEVDECTKNGGFCDTSLRIPQLGDRCIGYDAVPLCPGCYGSGKASEAGEPCSLCMETGKDWNLARSGG